MSRLLPSLAAFTGLATGLVAGETRGRARTAAAVAATTARLERELTPPPPPSPDEVRRTALLEIIARRLPPPVPDPGTSVTDLLFERLAPGDQDAVVSLLIEHPAALWEISTEESRRRLTLNFATAIGPPEVRERAGLLTATPPDEVHAMARGPVAAGGDFFLADMVDGAVRAAGLEIPAGGTLLDFGASSGRVLRAFSAARPDLRCVGCDPNEGAIAWATEHLPGEYFVSPIAPPLALDAASVDVAYAISIWSHFAAAPALAWLEEMRRVIRPGGALVITTHSWDTLAMGLRREALSHETIGDAAQALMAEGHHFIDVFGAAGDWGVVDPGWGNAYMTLEWLMAKTQGAWSARLLWPGYLDANQDVIVLQRRAGS
ncbi:class I SAM-dependent methyltransferase [Baekduia sp. Peel2402]|uniref:class I SAM-dependent methyltransferase n=1 Tax=Baekduia sp. Peel2402 TaxID=3458296 RepID=UPI00403E938A